jgi:hypothetical protein
VRVPLVMCVLAAPVGHCRTHSGWVRRCGTENCSGQCRNDKRGSKPRGISSHERWLDDPLRDFNGIFAKVSSRLPTETTP